VGVSVGEFVGIDAWVGWCFGRSYDASHAMKHNTLIMQPIGRSPPTSLLSIFSFIIFA